MNNAWLVAKLLTSAHEKRPKFALYTSNSLLPGTRMQPLLPNLYIVTFEVEMFLRIISRYSIGFNEAGHRDGMKMGWTRNSHNQTLNSRYPWCITVTLTSSSTMSKASRSSRLMSTAWSFPWNQTMCDCHLHS
jgi:hypothetical protein